MISTTNGNLYRSSTTDGTTVRRGAKRRRITDSSYKKFSDMPLTVEQKKEYRLRAKRNASASREPKWAGTYVATAQPLASTWSFVTLTDTITRSTGDTYRIGDSIEIKDLEMNYKVAGNFYGSLSQTARVVLVQFYENTAEVAFNTATVFNKIGSDYLDAYNHDKRSVYKVLYDETLSLSSNTGLAGQTRTVIVKPGRKYIEYNDAAVTARGHLYLMYVTDVSANFPTIEWSVVVNFYDS